VFVRLADAGAIRSPVLDAGCGTGEHALFLAARGHEVVGVDFAPIAIERALRKAQERGLAATFAVGDVLALERLDRKFATVIDSGTFHVFGPADRHRYVDSLGRVVEPGGVVHLLCFSEHEPDWGGPHRITQAELREAFADGWEVESIKPAEFEANLEAKRAQAWLARIARVGAARSPA
jgi:ubiquinone/menaquinone biosynthesis C-methylase UbiE